MKRGHALLPKSIATVGAILFVLPLVWLVTGSITPDSALVSEPARVLPSTVTHEGFSALSHDRAFIQAVLRSLVVAACSAGASVILGASAGYVAARTRGWIADVVIFVALLGYMISPVALAIPYFVMWKFFGLTNSVPGIAVAHMSFSLPYAVWSMRAYFMGLPSELEDRGLADGLGPLAVLCKVVAPAALPGVLTTFLFCFLLSWNEYVLARILASAPSAKTLPLAIDDLFHGALVDWNKIFAAGVIALGPALVIVIAAQRQLARGSMRLWS